MKLLQLTPREVSSYEPLPLDGGVGKSRVVDGAAMLVYRTVGV